MAFNDYMMASMGYGPNALETEEERKRREEEAAKARNIAAPVAPVAPTAAPASPTAPVAPDTYTSQQESGGNYNIGYHFPANDQGARTSTAFGAYGITAPAYKDIQAANPYFAGKDITTLTPEEQDQAQATYKQVLGKQLQAYNVQPTEENLRGAHFLGAKGLSDYLQTGAISPAAAAANGGEENVRKIIQGRLANQPSPSSGAVAPTAPVAPGQEFNVTPPTEQAGPPTSAMTEQGWAQRFILAQGNPTAMASIQADPNTPDWMKVMAADEQYTRMDQQKKLQQATTDVQKDVQTGDYNSLFRKITKGDEQGSIMKAALLKFVGLDDMAKQ